MKGYPLLLMLLLALSSFSQTAPSSTEKDITINPYIDGTLLLPNTESVPVLAILISDYGPTDRNGNQNFLMNNSLKKLATSLSKNGIASFRYDKRTSKELQSKNTASTVVFDDFVTDAKSVIEFFKSQNYFSKIYIIGHGQGSLVGMLAADASISGFISIGGSAKHIGDVIIDQVNATARQHSDDTKRVIATLKSGNTTTNYPEALSSIFSIENQPFMISWMTYEPQKIISNLEIPVAIINGTKDLQVTIKEAKQLANAHPTSVFYSIEGMNHVFFSIEGDNLENSKSYNEAFRNINPMLVTHILEFIKK